MGPSIELPYQKKLLKTYVSPETAAQLRATALAQGHSDSSFVRWLIETVLEDDDAPGETSKKARRETKVTVRLPQDVAVSLAADAKGQGVAPSTWTASILMAKFRNAPNQDRGSDMSEGCLHP